MVFKEIKNTEEFNTIISNSNVELVVAYFTASWCGPCKQIYPYVLNIGENNEHILALKIDIDICEELSSKYEISCMPTFKFFKNKSLSECESFSGADSNKLINMIKTLLGEKEKENENENENENYLKSIDNNPQNNTFNSNNTRGISGFSNFNNGFDNFSNF